METPGDGRTAALIDRLRMQKSVKDELERIEATMGLEEVLKFRKASMLQLAFEDDQIQIAFGGHDGYMKRLVYHSLPEPEPEAHERWSTSTNVSKFSTASGSSTASGGKMPHAHRLPPPKPPAGSGSGWCIVHIRNAVFGVEQYDRDTAIKLLAGKYDAAEFDAVARGGKVSREDLLKLGAPSTSVSHCPSSRTFCRVAIASSTRDKEVKLLREAGQTLGIDLKDAANGGVIVSFVDADYLANHKRSAESGQIHEGDVVLSINGHSVVGMSADVVLSLIPTSGYVSLMLRTVHRQKDRDVLLKRDGVLGGSLGLVLGDGTNGEVKVVTLHTGQIAAKTGKVHTGDIVLSVNGRSAEGLKASQVNALIPPRQDVILTLRTPDEERRISLSSRSASARLGLLLR